MLIYLALAILILGIGYILLLEFFIVRREVKNFPILQTERIVRRLITKKYLLGISRSNFLLIIVALATALIGAYSAQISFQERNQTEIFNKLSVKPHLDISLYNSTDSSAGFEFYSDGLGPAIVKWASVSVDKKLEPNWEAVSNDLKFPSEVDFRYFNPTVGASYPIGGPYALYQISPGNNSKYFLLNAGRIDIKICYCSQYSEIDGKQCWQTGNKLEFIKNSCDQAPDLFFGEKPVFVSPKK